MLILSNHDVTSPSICTLFSLTPYIFISSVISSISIEHYIFFNHTLHNWRRGSIDDIIFSNYFYSLYTNNKMYIFRHVNILLTLCLFENLNNVNVQPVSQNLIYRFKGLNRNNQSQIQQFDILELLLMLLETHTSKTVSNDSRKGNYVQGNVVKFYQSSLHM